jgi:transmembrane sensor
MANNREGIEAEAIGWVIRLRDAPAEDWEAFTAWLEADPAHAAAYEEAALVDAGLDDLPRSPARPILPAEPAPGRHSGTRRHFLGWGIAAALVGAIGLATWPTANAEYEVATGPGEHRQVALADGSQIDLNGSTRLVLDRDNPRFARLERGEALFTVVHDESRPFEVTAGDVELRDLGTVFNVVRGDRAFEVAVAEGAVMFNPEREAVELRPGMVLRQARGGAAAVSRSDPEAITGWREGRLTFTNADVARVADDLSRNLGRPVTASPRVAARSFTGIIILDRDPQVSVERASALLGLQARREGNGWALDQGGRGTP